MDCQLYAGVSTLLGALIGGLSAIGGAYIASSMQRKTAHRIWMLERRAEIFTVFLSQLHKCIEDASMYFRQNPPDSLTSSQQLIDIYFPVMDYSRIVRLFLREQDRERFEQLVRDIFATHANRTQGDNRLIHMGIVRKELQAILEDHLHNP